MCKKIRFKILAYGQRHETILCFISLAIVEAPTKIEKKILQISDLVCLNLKTGSEPSFRFVNALL